MTRRRLSPGVFLLAAAVTLVPWIAWLATSLPCHYQSRHWGIAWAGFDTGLALALGLTGLAALRRAAWLDRAAVATAALLIADAWVDIVTSRGAVTVAVAEALALELPIAAFCLCLARSTTSLSTSEVRLRVGRPFTRFTAAADEAGTNDGLPSFLFPREPSSGWYRAPPRPRPVYPRLGRGRTSARRRNSR